MSLFTASLVRLYPHAWRVRYGDEMRELLSSQPFSLRTLVDLIAGAVDARLSPQLAPVEPASATNGAHDMVKAFSCSSAGVPVRDQWRSVAWMLGGSLGLTLVGIALQLRIGDNAFSEGLLYSAFPASLMLSSECTYLKRYSAPARSVISIGGAVVVILTMWAAVAIAQRI
jgi:hypothetical protein